MVSARFMVLCGLLALPAAGCDPGQLSAWVDLAGPGDGGPDSKRRDSAGQDGPGAGDGPGLKPDAPAKPDLANKQDAPVKPDMAAKPDAPPKLDGPSKPDMAPKPDAKPKPDLAPKPDAKPKPDLAPKPDAPPKPDLAPKPDGPSKPDMAPYLDVPAASPDSGAPVPYTGSFPAGTGELNATLGVAGYSRTLKVYRPAGLAASPPLMIAFHGTNGTAYDMIKPWSAFAREMADKFGVVLVAPQARKLPVGDWDNHFPNDIYWETYPSVDPAKNPDLLLVQAVILEAKKAYNVDIKRVYTLGHSSGGFFSILTAIRLPDKIAAFVSNSAGLVRCATLKSCTFVGSGTSCAGYKGQAGYCSCAGDEKPGPVAAAGRKPPGYLVHASDDTAVSVQYTCELAERMAALNYSYSLNISTGHGHSVPYNMAVDAWPFISKYSLP